MEKSKQAKVKTPYSRELGFKKRLLYRDAHQRLKRAINEGFYIEAVVLTESLMSDRLESALSQITNKDKSASTLGRLFREFQTFVEMDQEFIQSIWRWNENRGFVVHQMVKMTNSVDSTWRERLHFARMTAREGSLLLAKLRKYTDPITRKKS